MHICDAVRQGEEVKVDVRTLDGKPVTSRHATVPIGTALRIVPAFRATTLDDDAPLRCTIEARYNSGAGRYLVTRLETRVTNEDGDISADTLRRVRLGELKQAATPQCIFVQPGDDIRFVSVSALSSGERILPDTVIEQTLRLGPRGDALEIVQLVFGVAALTGQPPAKALVRELGLAQRTAVDWIRKARDAGLLEGIKYAAARPADG